MSFLIGVALRNLNRMGGEAGAEYRGEICISILKPVSCDERYTGLMRSPWKGKPAYAQVVPTALSRLL